MRILWIFGLLFGFVLFWIVLFEPFNVQKKPKSGGEASFEDFRYYELTPQGVHLFLEGDVALKANRRLTITHFRMLQNGDTLKADKGIYTKKRIELFGNIFYNHTDYNLTTSRARYDTKPQVLHITAPFTIVSSKLQAKAQKGTLYKKLGTIEAETIQATIEEE